MVPSDRAKGNEASGEWENETLFAIEISIRGERLRRIGPHFIFSEKGALGVFNGGPRGIAARGFNNFSPLFFFCPLASIFFARSPRWLDQRKYVESGNHSLSGPFPSTV